MDVSRAACRTGHTRPSIGAPMQLLPDGRQAGSNGANRVSWNYFRIASLGRNPRLDHQTKPGLSGANGLIATILEPNAENRGAVCSQSRRSLPSADGQTEDMRHEEQREQLAAPTIPPGDIFYRR
jgi:hypothetical protein